MGVLTVIGLGYKKEHLTLEAVAQLQNGLVCLRTAHCAAAEYLLESGIAFEAFDELYESSADFDALYECIYARITTLLQTNNVCYCVPGSGGMRDNSVQYLHTKGLTMQYIAGVDDISIALGSGLPMAQGAFSIVPAAEITSFAIDITRPLVVEQMDTQLLAGEVKLQLLEYYPPNFECYLFFGEKSHKINVKIVEIDRQMRYHHTCVLFLPPCENPERYGLAAFESIMDKLYDPVDGCPWDAEQTHESLTRYLLEEAYEAIDAIENGDTSSLISELGDVLLQVVFHATIGKEANEFTLRDVITAVSQKMIDRHPHIFGQATAETAEDVLDLWEEIKRKEKGLTDFTGSLLDVPKSLPALLRAYKTLSRAEDAGYFYQSENCPEVQTEQEWSALAFGIALAARKNKIDPEIALNKATDAFVAQFARMEQAAKNANVALNTLQANEILALWDAARQ